MSRYIYKTIVYLSMFGLGVFHLSSKYEVWPIVLYYICIYVLLFTLVLSLNKSVAMSKYDKWENVALMAYMGLVMLYVVSKYNPDYNTYLNSLGSDLYAGIFTFVVLLIMFSFQGINLMRYVKKR